MNERTKRINRAYRWLIWLGEVDDKLTFAKRLGKERANITNILNGKGDASDRFCGIILQSFPGIFNRDWLLDGTGDMLATADGLPTCPFSVSSAQPVETDTPEQRQSIIDLYSGLIKESESFRREIKDELSEIRTLREELRETTCSLNQALNKIENSGNTQVGIAANDSEK